MKFTNGSFCFVFLVMIIAGGCSRTITSTSVDVRKDSTSVRYTEKLRDTTVAVPYESTSVSFPLLVLDGKVQDVAAVKKVSGRSSMTVSVKNGEVNALSITDSALIKLYIRDIFQEQFVSTKDSSSNVTQVPVKVIPRLYKYGLYFAIFCIVLLFAYACYRIGRFTIKPV